LTKSLPKFRGLVFFGPRCRSTSVAVWVARPRLVVVKMDVTTTTVSRWKSVSQHVPFINIIYTTNTSQYKYTWLWSFCLFLFTVSLLATRLPCLNKLEWLDTYSWGGASKRPPWSTVRCPAWLQLTWPLTVSCHLKQVVVSWLKDLCRQADLHQLWWPICFTAAGPTLWNYYTSQLVLGKWTSAVNSLSGC